jgi:hypothetical protein
VGARARAPGDTAGGGRGWSTDPRAPHFAKCALLLNRSDRILARDIRHEASLFTPVVCARSGLRSGELRLPFERHDDASTQYLLLCAGGTGGLPTSPSSTMKNHAHLSAWR